MRPLPKDTGVGSNPEKRYIIAPMTRGPGHVLANMRVLGGRGWIGGSLYTQPVLFSM